MSDSHGNGPTTVLDHFRMEFRSFAHQGTNPPLGLAFQTSDNRSANKSRTSPAGFLEAWRGHDLRPAT
jgi:hypothetical protein